MFKSLALPHVPSDNVLAIFLKVHILDHFFIECEYLSVNDDPNELKFLYSWILDEQREIDKSGIWTCDLRRGSTNWAN